MVISKTKKVARAIMSFLPLDELDPTLSDVLAFIDDFRSSNSDLSSSTSSSSSSHNPVSPTTSSDIPSKRKKSHAAASRRFQQKKKAELLAFRVQVTALQKRLKELEDNAARIGPLPALDETQKRNLVAVWTRRAELEKQLRLVAEEQNRQLKTVLARQTQAAKVVRKLLQNVTTAVTIEEGLRTPHPAESGLSRFVPNLDDAIYNELASRMGNMLLETDEVFANVESKRFIPDVVEVRTKSGIPYIELRAALPVPVSVKEMSVMIQQGKSYDPNRFKKHEVTKLGLKKESQIELNDPSTTMTVNLMSLGRMHDDNNRHLSFWTSLVCDHPLNPAVRFREQGWIMVSASPSSPQQHSVLQVCYRLSPDLQPGPIYNSSGRDAATMTVFVLQNLGDRMRKKFLSMEILYSNAASKP
ncbi:hypothetical protein P3T76_014925 [Phytophthora citrophthora]|uniref:M96 mating-specific protein family n=1 Tax=Phytophthora citrophthora TaxID=4793 RepID=A0AAD9LBH0_9STRA|nr:hypothetical protein P3T76_014925 [Phytophthora citrophthora]